MNVSTPPVVSFQPLAQLQVQVNPKSIFAGVRSYVISYDNGVPTTVVHYQGNGGGLKPVSELTPDEQQNVARLTAAANAIANYDFPEFNTRPHRSSSYGTYLKNDEFILQLDHWPGAPTSSRMFAGKLGDVTSAAPASIQDAAAAIRLL
ncbi:MAG: hypothetical protein H7123_08395 [Thermoleophilia bacterium]|nr:hypothetical protein [Thermoleophilia bacterium]